MNVRVKLFAAARDAVGCDFVEVQLPEAASIADLRRTLAATCPALGAWSSHLLFAMDCRYTTDTTLIDVEAELAAFPPVSGG